MALYIQQMKRKGASTIRWTTCREGMVAFLASDRWGRTLQRGRRISVCRPLGHSFRPEGSSMLTGRVWTAFLVEPPRQAPARLPFWGYPWPLKLFPVREASRALPWMVCSNFPRHSATASRRFPVGPGRSLYGWLAIREGFLSNLRVLLLASGDWAGSAGPARFAGLYARLGR